MTNAEGTKIIKSLPKLPRGKASLIYSICSNSRLQAKTTYDSGEYKISLKEISSSEEVRGQRIETGHIEGTPVSWKRDYDFFYFWIEPE